MKYTIQDIRDLERKIDETPKRLVDLARVRLDMIMFSELPELMGMTYAKLTYVSLPETQLNEKANRLFAFAKKLFNNYC